MNRPTPQQLTESEPGFYKKGSRPCNHFNQGYRCTRQMFHEGPHAAHMTRGIEGTMKQVRMGGASDTDENPEYMMVPREPGMKTEETIQVATWL